ncbi:MAG: hypothetical protein F4060_15145 [Holophagales bacterium]|nr:hypothetical protein [Holophagales bacterium]MYG29161.1 hypothetical protein [Holophagales bacterium]MYI81269.1 hypothetical protein [Holophagales bacterium]
MPFWLPLGITALLVLAIYLIRPTAQALPVASTVLWRRLLAARKRRRDRLRWLLSLLLATTVAGFLSVGASRAPWLQPGGGDPIALAFDPSPTMQAGLPDGGPSRIELAAAEARRIVVEAESGSRFTVNADPTPLTSTEVLAVLSDPFPGLSNAPDTEPAIPTARRVHVFTDGIGPYTPIVDPGTETNTVSVLVPARNAGIVRFATRPPATRATGPEALLEILATDPAGGTVPVELTVADSETIRIRRQLEVEPGDRFTALIDLGSFAPGPVTARIAAPGDVFPLDNRAGLIDAGRAGTASTRLPVRHARSRTEPRRVLVTARSPVSFDGSAAALALEADASVDVVAVRAATGADDPPPEDPIPAADIATFHRAAPAIPPAMPALYLDPPQAVAAGGLSPAAEAPLSQHRIDRTDASHPLLAGVSLLGLPVVVAARELDPRCSALASAGDRTAIAVCDPPPDGGPRSIAVAFDLDHSSLAQRPDLAALFQNAASWLTETPAITGDLTTDTGLQDERATRINDSTLEPAPGDRLADLDSPNRRPWSWRTLALAGLLLASFEAITFFRGLTL